MQQSVVLPHRHSILLYVPYICLNVLAAATHQGNCAMLLYFSCWPSQQYADNIACHPPASSRGRRPKQLPKGERPPRAPRPAGAQGASKARTAVVTQYNRDTNAFIRRKVRVLDPDAIVQLRIPDPPLPLSWGRRVLPYAPPAIVDAGVAALDDGVQRPARAAHAPTATSSDATAGHCAEPSGSAQAGRASEAPAASSSSCHVVPDLTTFDFRQQLQQVEFQALLINTGWEGKDSDGGAHTRDGGATAGPSTAAGRQPTKQRRGSNNVSVAARVPEPTVARLAQLPIPQLCPKGFVFIWAPKQHIQGGVQVILYAKYSYNCTT